MSPITTLAHSILCETLTARGNVLSGAHSTALMQLVDVMSEYVHGQRDGRWAFALDTGLGKTTAAAAFIAALYRSGSTAAVSVAASKVRALSDFKRELVGHFGVPEELIGLKYAPNGEAGLLPSTGDQSRRYQLVTHSRVRGGRDLALFAEHEGQPRALMIYDETLWRSSTIGVPLLAVRQALAAWDVDRTPASGGAFEYLKACSALAQSALTQLATAGDPEGTGAAVAFEPREAFELAAYAEAVQRATVAPAYREALHQLLDISQEALRVLLTEQGSGLLHASEAVPAELRNVLVLDASYGIRRLAHFDISVRQEPVIPAVKRYDRVQVVQLLAAGGRSSIEESLRAKLRERSAVVAEVADIMRERWQEPGPILVFTFKAHSRLDPVAELRRGLRDEGIDCDATLKDGSPKVYFLTYGSETSLNGFERCTTVILAGVLHRSMIDLAAVVRGQAAHPAAATPNRLLRSLVESEVAHVVYQAGSRGAMRRVDSGQALPMHLYVIHRNPDLQSLLEPVMPGARWELRQPVHLKASNAKGRTLELATAALAYLRSVPETVREVKTAAVRTALGLAGSSSADKMAFKRALDEVLSGGCWAKQGHSLVRIDGAYFFGD